MTRSKHPRGFTIAEMLIALAILAALLASVAVALHASLQSYAQNNNIAQLSQASRGILSRLHNEVRTAVTVASTSTRLTITPADDGSGLTRIQYELTGGQLHYRRTVSGSTSDYILLGDDEITVATFNVIREENTSGTVLSVRVVLKLTLDGESFDTVTTANLRRNQSY